MDIRKVKKLIELIDKTGVAEIEVREGEESIRVSRYGAVQSPPHQPAVHQAPATAQTPTTPESAQKAEPEITGHAVKSPMVGTVYLAPTPGADPFVKVGDHVDKGHVICLIEAMKMYNQIEADKSGVISARLVENEQPVEYDQPLFIIDDE